MKIWKTKLSGQQRMSKLLITKKSKLHTQWDQSIIEIPLRTRNHAMVTLNQKQLIMKFTYNKSKMKILTNRRQLKGKRIAIMEDMAQKNNRRKNQPMGSAWFVNGKISYKRQGKAIVRELRSWNDL